MINAEVLSESEIEEYAEIVAVLRDYQRYTNLYHLHFCGSVKGEFVYDPEREERNNAFYAGWPERKQVIIARIKKDNYFVRNGKIGDKKELRKKDTKFQELRVYYELRDKFAALESVLARQASGSSLDQHIEMLRKRRDALEAKSLEVDMADIETKSEKAIQEAKSEISTLSSESQKTKN